MKPFPRITCEMGLLGTESRGIKGLLIESEEPSVEILSLLPVDPIDPLLPVTDKILAEFKAAGSSQGGRFPFHIKEANHEQ